MITISLDEYGQFEKEDRKPLFIAGVVFDDQNDPTEEATERKRVAAYYRRVLADAGEGFTYPNDLHSNGNAWRDRNVIKPVKTKVAESLGEFLSRGTYGGMALQDRNNKKFRDRKGKYHIFVMLKSDDGKKNLLTERASMLARDDYAANRYFHMASSVVNRLIFHNPLYNRNMPAVSVDVATRSTGSVNELDAITREEFKSQGYKQRESNSKDKYNYFSIMNADIYRTIIAQEMINSGNTDIRIEQLNINSIQYYQTQNPMEFLYLSDSICSLLGFELPGESADDWLQEIDLRVKKLNPDAKNLVFGYDEIDNEFASAWSYCERKNLFKALSLTYDAKNRKGKFAEYYRCEWFPYLEQRIKDSVTPDIFTKSINELSDSLVSNNLDQEKLVYMMHMFEEMIPLVSDKYKDSDLRASVLYKLYDAGVSAFCHIGAAKRAMDYYTKCRKYAFYIGVDAFLRTNNKLAVCLEDSFEWDEALKLAADTVAGQQLASEMKREILNNGDESDFLEEAKAISQYARILAEKRDISSEEHFRSALSKLEHGSANYKITQSYLLHFYADMGWKDKFEEEATDYFDGKNTYNQRFRYLIKFGDETHSTFSNEYAMYVLVRGLFCFGRQLIEEEFWERLSMVYEILEKKDGKEPGGHPWDIIYKYLEMIAHERGDFAATKKFRELRKNCLKYKGAIIEAIEKYGDAQISDFMGDIVGRDLATEELAKFMKTRFDSMKEKCFSFDGETRYNELGDYFTFMFR